MSLAHRIALENPKVKADMVEAGTFPELASHYQVTGVPKTIINEDHELVGAHPLKKILEVIEQI